MNRYLIAAFLWAGFILLLTLTPGKSMPDIDFFSYDKLGHAGVFMIFSFLLMKGVWKPHEKNNLKIIVTLLISACYGLAIEIAQHFIPDRGMEWYDALANVIGSFLGIAVLQLSNMLKA